MSERDIFDFGYQQLSAGEKTARVTQVFESVASRYDIMNDVMSLGLHRYWKQCLFDMMRPRSHQRLLDVAGGSGDIALGFLRAGGGKVSICDISEGMLGHGRAKAYDCGIVEGIDFICGSAEALPIGDCEVDIYSIGFGLRNVVRRDLALREAYRVLKPGGRFFCLEFCPRVSPLLERIYDHYSFSVIPWLGDLIAGDRESYRYLVESIRCFPPPRQLLSMLDGAGFELTRFKALSGGLVAIHSGWKI